MSISKMLASLVLVAVQLIASSCRTDRLISESNEPSYDQGDNGQQNVDKTGTDDQSNHKKMSLEATIRTTSWGVVHVKASDYAGLGYGAAYAFSRDNFCVLADFLVTVNGERSKYFGPQSTVVLGFTPVENIKSDFFVKAYLDEAVLARDFHDAPAPVRALVKGYVAGYNRYLQEAGLNNLPTACKNQPWVRPMTERDMYRSHNLLSMLSSGLQIVEEMVAAKPPIGNGQTSCNHRSPPPRPSKEAPRHLEIDTGLALGSNAYALGKNATGRREGMLLGNPHFPWGPTIIRFYQIHLTIPGQLDVMGASMANLPVVLIGFNKDVAWSHTISTSARGTFYQLALSPKDSTSYIYDGQPRRMTSKQIEVEVKQADGTVTKQSRKFYFSHYGPMVQSDSLPWNASQAYTFRDANYHNARMIEQWLRLDQARNVREMRQALIDVMGIPYVNTLAADRAGKAFYADIGATPNVSIEQWSNCVKVPAAKMMVNYRAVALDGSRSYCEWVIEPGAREPGLFAGAGMPELFRDDYLANMNNSYWLANPGSPLSGYSPIFGAVGTEQFLRARLGLLQIRQRLDGSDGLAGKGFESLSSLQQVMFSNRNLAAELVVDGLVAICEKQSRITLASTNDVVDLSAACAVLRNWDRQVNVNSAGAVLFREFWIRLPNGWSYWEVPFDPSDPVGTPRGLRTGDARVKEVVLQQLGEAVKALANLGIALDTRLGEQQFVVRNGTKVPLSGGPNAEGIFNILEPGGPLTPHGYPETAYGNTYIQTVTWNDSGPQAEAILTYSQSSDPANPHYSDQTVELFAKQKFAKLPFFETEIRSDPNFQEVSISE